MQSTTLRKISSIYLAIPNLIFIWGWFNISIAASCTIILCYLMLIELTKKSGQNEFIFTGKDVAFLILTVSTWTFLSGSGGYSFQIADYPVHNSKFFDLATKEWPYYFHQGNRLVRYYFGYYLAPALIFKITGNVNSQVIFLWTFFGFLIGLSWVYLLLGRNRVFTIVFILIGGCGTFLFKVISYFYHFQASTYKFNLNIGSIFDQSRWIPNQVIPSLIVACLIINDCINRREFINLVVPISLTLVWAVFPFISLSLIYATVLIYYTGYSQLKNKLFTKKILVTLIWIAPILSYFSSGEKAPINGIIWGFHDKILVLKYALGAFLDIVVLYFIFKFSGKNNNDKNDTLLNLLFGVFSLLSLIVIGKWNDWLTKMNIGFIVIFLIAILNNLQSDAIRSDNISFKSLKLSLLFIYMFMNLAQLYSVLAPQLKSNLLISYFNGKKYSQVQYNKHGDLYNTLINEGSFEDGQQYMAKRNSFYEKYLRK